jgi:hypothetical protein
MSQHYLDFFEPPRPSPRAHDEVACACVPEIMETHLSTDARRGTPFLRPLRVISLFELIVSPMIRAKVIASL